ncbi:MAG: sugar phosphate isomerase/epimerase family protein, partial [Verrucomicrobiales bacterium]
GCLGPRAHAVFAAETAASSPSPGALPIYKAIKYNMIRDKVSLLEKFEQSKRAGYHGISLMHPADIDLDEAVAARDASGLPIHNVNQGTHWKVRLSDPDPAVRAQGLADTLACLRFAKACGADSILLVIGKVTDEENENHQQVRARSAEQIRKMLPLAAELGVRILCENVGNGFCSDAQAWAEYIDSFESPWVGAFFDIGNHQGYGGAPHWIRTLGHRIVKIDVKDHDDTTEKNCNLFEGDVDWPDVRAALAEIRFTGWATAEVRGGDEARLTEVARNMDKALGLGARRTYIEGKIEHSEPTGSQ